MMNQPDPRAQLHAKISLYFGERGVAWLAGLAERLDGVAERWGLELGEPFPNLSINYVAEVVRADRSDVVLKCGVPNRESATEAAALLAFGGRGAVRVLESDPEEGMLLLERVRPGREALLLADDDEATRAAASVMKRLHRSRVPTDGPFPTLNDWFEGLARHRTQFDGGSGPIPADLFDRAEQIAGELLDSTEQISLLHGDLHHENILSAEREPWLAIDPKGIHGDPCFEVAPFLRNPIKRLLAAKDLRTLLSRRISILHDHLNYDPQRMIRWVAAESVLSAIWDLDDPSEGWRRELEVARAAGELLV